LVLGAVGIGVEATLFFMTLEHLGASLAGIFLYLYPAFVAILSHLFLNEKLTLKKWGCVFLALLGSVLTAGVIGGAGAGMVAPLSDGIGLVAGILSGAWYAVYILAGSRLTRDEDPIWVSSGVVLGSLLTFLILCLTTAGSNPVVGRSVGQNGWIAVVGLAVLSTVLPFSTLYAGMKRVGAVKASLLSTLELVFTIILAYLFLGEKLTIEQGAGGILILISVLLSVKAE
jgi:drug/metabolite transporter (DMT)-like permease